MIFLSHSVRSFAPIQVRLNGHFDLTQGALPACYFAEDENKNHMVIDGVQRITSIKRFFNNEFALTDLTVFREYNGMRFNELPTTVQNDIENYTIRCIILRKENKQELIQDIFARLNQGAVSLTNQEIRHALFMGPLDSLLKELSEIPRIQNFGIGKSGKRNKNGLESQEMVLRFFAMRGDLSDYDDNFHKYLDKFMEANKNLASNEILKMRELFISTLQKCESIFGNNSFIDTTKEKPKESMVYYDLLMWRFQDLSKAALIKNKTKILGKFAALCKDEKFQKSLSGRLQDKTSIQKRRALWLKKLGKL